MKTIPWFVALIVLGSFSSVEAALPSFSAYFYRLPKAERDCHVQAKALKDLFQTISEVSVTQAICLNSTALSYDIQLVYSAPEELPIVDTIRLPGALQPDRYADLETCQKSLPKQTEIFESATGLKSFLHYCSPRSYFERPEWSPGIYALGKPQRFPFSGGYHLYTASSYMSPTEYLTGLRAALARHDGVLAEVIIHPNLAWDFVSIHYFAPEPLHFALYVVGRTHADKKSPAQCEAQAEYTRKLLSGVTNAPFSFYCGYLGMTGTWEMNMVTAGALYLRWRNSIEKFHTYDECLFHRDSLVKTYQATEKGILGAICSTVPTTQDGGVDPDAYYLILFKDIGPPA
ncbi:MAG: hypothetical protein HYR96_03125 [Deltaproteobacteria bacterium]|nr:hypothetical protein [Deltaproteobacteria bacterium]MBI3294091.1 hypothetical protein [Deltaproteobacteria bacterium]